MNETKHLCKTFIITFTNESPFKSFVTLKTLKALNILKVLKVLNLVELSKKAISTIEKRVIIVSNTFIFSFVYFYPKAISLISNSIIKI